MDINLDDLHTEMNSLNAKIKALQEEASKTSQEVFKQSLAKFFTAVPEITAITWTQYTPYFNDGEACEFGVGEPNFYSKYDTETKSDDDEDEDEEFEFDPHDYMNNPFAAPSDYVYKSAADTSNKYRESYQADIDKYNALTAEVGEERIVQVNRAIEDVKKLFTEIDDDYFRMMFDDHVFVVATKSGFEVHEYSHD